MRRLHMFLITALQYEQRKYRLYISYLLSNMFFANLTGDIIYSHPQHCLEIIIFTMFSLRSVAQSLISSLSMMVYTPKQTGCS